MASGPTVDSKSTDSPSPAPTSAKNSDFNQRAAFQITVPHAQPPSIPDYELLRRIGGGSYGEVWLAKSATGALRALKVVWRHTFEDDRPFQREFEGIQLFERLSREHPSQLALFHVGCGEGYFFYVMELADDAFGEKEKRGEGERESETPVPVATGGTAVSSAPFPPFSPASYTPHTLRADLGQGRLPAARVLEIGLALTEALAHLHSHGLVHRDIKPSNIIFVGGKPKLADIGLVTDAGDARSIVGTEGYLAPEGPGTPQADLFAFGKVLYEAATGLDRRQFPQLPPDIRTWPDAKLVFELNEILLNACARDARQRYQSAEEMQADLALLRRGESVKRKRAVRRRVALLKVVGAVAAVVALFFFVVGLLSSRQLEQKRIRRQEAEKVYQEGRRYVNTQTKEGFSRAVDLFHQAIAIDPNYAPAYLGLAHAHYSVSGWHLPPRQAMPTARWAASKALELDNSSDDAHVWLGKIKSHYDWDWAGAEAEFKRAIHLKPQSGTAHECYAMFLAALGRRDEARAEMELSKPLVQVTHRVCYSYGLVFYFDRQYDKAIEQALRGLTLETNSVLNHFLLMDSYLMKELYPEAIVEAQKLRSLDDSPAVVAELGYIYAAMGRTNEARQCLAQLEHDSTTRHVSAYFRGFIHLGLGEKEKALDCLEQAYEERFGWMANLKVEPALAALCAEPRFIALLKKLGLEKTVVNESGH